MRMKIMRCIGVAQVGIGASISIMKMNIGIIMISGTQIGEAWIMIEEKDVPVEKDMVVVMEAGDIVNFIYRGKL
jgi:hypothetical protein